MFVLTASIVFLLFILHNAQNIQDSESQCRFAALQNNTEYHAFTSILRMPYGPCCKESDKLGWKENIFGINTNGTIYGVGGWYFYGSDPTKYVNRYFIKSNVYNSWISYDDTIAQEWGAEVQNSWTWSNGELMPEVEKPSSISTSSYTGTKGGFFCPDGGVCSTYIGDILYIINAKFTNDDSDITPKLEHPFWSQDRWPKMIQFNMSAEQYVDEQNFTADLPYNSYVVAGTPDSAPFDKTNLNGPGCTTNNGTHVFHFNFNNFNDESTFSYNIERDEWLLLSGNPETDKYHFGCAPDISGRYIYLLGGSRTGGTEIELSLSPSLETDKYDTWTDSWQRINKTDANYPEIYGRLYPIAITDKTSNQIILFGGKTYDPDAPGSNSEDKWISVEKIETFQLNDETWIINQDITKDVYLPQEASSIAVVKVDDFKPLGQISNNSADTVFIFGGASNTEGGNNKIAFVSILTEREYYDDDTVVIQGNNEFLYEDATFDSHQRFELGFRVVFPVGIPDEELFNDNWDISFLIDGKDIDSINQQYNTQIMAREGCRDECECLNLPSNVKQVVVAQLLIPSRRTLNNGYCVDYNQDWIFEPNSNSTITILVSNAIGQVVYEQDFTFKFAKIELMDESKANLYNIERGCFVHKKSDGALSSFEIRCDGYSCNGCEEEGSIGRIDGRPPFVIEYNVLMNDVLLAPDAYVLQHHDYESIVGTQSLSKDSLIALVRAKTKLGTWYEECFEHFFFNFTEQWDTLNQVLTDTSADILYDQVINGLNSGNNEDVVAAYSILKTMISDNKIPDDEDPAAEITNALSMIINKDTDTSSIDDITSNVALVDLLTSDTDLVDPSIALEISSDWLPDVLNKTIQIFDDAGSDIDSNIDPGALADTVQKVGDIANSAATNLLETVNSSSNFSDTEKNQIIEDIQGMMEKELTGTWVGEEIVHRRQGAVTSGKIIPTKDECRSGLLSITIPPNGAATNSDTVKCIITTTDDDDNAIDLFDSSGTKVFTTNDSCLPYFISMNIPSKFGSDAFDLALKGEWYNTSGIEYPSCIFWDNLNSRWDGTGCVIHSFDNDSVICACTHLTQFRVSGESFNPQAQLLSPSDFNILTTSNIQSHPTTWVTMLMIVVVLVVACICVPNNNADKPIIAFEDIIYKEFRDQYLHKHQQWHEIQQIDRWYTKIAQTKREMSISGQGHDEYSKNDHMNGSPLFSQLETPSISPSSPRKSTKIRKKRKQGKYYCLLSVNLFKTYLKNDHTVLSVFQRTDGTNFSTKQRIGLFLLYMYCIMMADAIFYGNQIERRPMGELTASALISLIGTCPVYLIRVLFQWSKPRVVKSAKTRNGSVNTVNTVNTNDKNELLLIDGEEEEQQHDDDEEEEEEEEEEEKSYDSDEEMKDEEYLKKTGQIHDTNTKKRLSNTYWSAIAELKKTTRPDMRLVRKCMHYVNTKANASEKASLASEIRLILFNYNYPFPHWYKKMAWAVLILMCLLCVVLSVIYGIQFDIKAAKQSAAIENNENIQSELDNIENNNGECWNISHQLTVKHEVYSQQILDIQSEQNILTALDEPYNDDISGDIYDSTKWLLNVLISFLTSVFVWQPLSIYLLTWIKIWAFHNGLIMEASVYNMWMFCCCCCTNNTKRKSNKNKVMLEKSIVDDDKEMSQRHAKKQKQSYVPEDSEMYELSVSGSGFAAVGNEDRALDVIGFLCNDELFVDLPDDFESSYTH